MGSINIIKPLNATQSAFSYLLSILSGRPHIYGMPVAAGIELTNCCNLRCPECLTGTGSLLRPAGYMDANLYKRIVDELRPYLYNINLYFQGEPMLHPDFFSFIENSLGLKLTISTNGHFLSKENASKLAHSGHNTLIVSLDGMDQETYSIYRRNGDFEKVKTGILEVAKAIRETGSSLKLEIQFLVNRYNENQIENARQFAAEANASLRVKSMQVINSDRIEEWMPENNEFRRYKRKNDSYEIRSRLKNRCLRLWLNPVITWDGKVIPCCFDKNADHVLGDLNKSSFREIWNGEKFRDFRYSVLNSRKETDICRNCTSGIRGVRY
jgi:radical SAM protein with 4Fe4S-binding SPASM domain